MAVALTGPRVADEITMSHCWRQRAHWGDREKSSVSTMARPLAGQDAQPAGRGVWTCTTRPLPRGVTGNLLNTLSTGGQSRQPLVKQSVISHSGEHACLGDAIERLC